MVAKSPPPAFVQALPAPVRTMLRKQCGGDWRRVTRTPEGAIVVHNQPQTSDPAPAVAARRRPAAAPGPVIQARPTPATISAPTFRPQPAAPRYPSPRPERDQPGADHPPGYPQLGAHGLMIVPRTKPTARKRSGSPRNAVELTKRILDMGAQFRRIPRSPKMKVYYLGYYLMEVWVADNTPPQILRSQYRKIREHLNTIDDFFYRQQDEYLD